MPKSPTTDIEAEVLPLAQRNSDRVLQEREIAIWDEANPRSIVRMLPKGTSEKAQMARQKRPDLFELDEVELKKQIKFEGAKLSPTDNRLRHKFWFEYDAVQATLATRINIQRVTAGICDQSLFTKKYMEDPARVAWILCPPTAYMAKIDEALSFGIDQIRDFLEEEHLDPITKKLNVPLAKLKFEIVKFLDLKQHGPMVQKLLSVHAHTDVNSGNASWITRSMEKPSMEQLHQKLDELRREREALENGGIKVKSYKEVIISEAEAGAGEGEEESGGGESG